MDFSKGIDDLQLKFKKMEEFRATQVQIFEEHRSLAADEPSLLEKIKRKKNEGSDKSDTHSSTTKGQTTVSSVGYDDVMDSFVQISHEIHERDEAWIGLSDKVTGHLS
jgi:CHASE3 domain sensor protein